VDRQSGSHQRTAEVIGASCPHAGPTAAYALSGGNRQLIIGRELLADPIVLLASHPTRGIDVGAQAAVWDILRQARIDGLAVLLISADLDELIGLSDSLLVISRGRIVAGLDPATVTPAELGSYMTAAHAEEGESAA
jgi:simple sugar transport system ATP-binding protein